jgi:cytosine/adenosine deaminase-related metal-dependent hydrolase
MTASRVVRARWILPIDQPPLEDGWIQFDAERIQALGRGRPPAQAEDFGEATILPGLVNAHTHLELSWMAGRVPPAASMVEWIRGLLRQRTAGPPGGGANAIREAERALIHARATGTVLVGDISNGLMSPALMVSHGLAGTVFHELLGFSVRDPRASVRRAWGRLDDIGEHAGVRYSVVAHAPYSVAPALFSAIAHAQRESPLSVHLAESAEELEFLQTGRGPFRDLLEETGGWDSAWAPPGQDPVSYVEALGYLTPGCLVVHGVHLTPAALERLRERQAVIVTCPRSNEWVGAGMPPVSQFYASGMPVAIGTDSLASVGSLNLFDEMAALRRIAPEVSAGSLLESATRTGAEALGHGDRYGSIAPGKRPALLAVRVPAGLTDVEEYLVGGIPSHDIHWVGPC